MPLVIEQFDSVSTRPEDETKRFVFTLKDTRGQHQCARCGDTFGCSSALLMHEFSKHSSESSQSENKAANQAANKGANQARNEAANQERNKAANQARNKAANQARSKSANQASHKTAKQVRNFVPSKEKLKVQAAKTDATVTYYDSSNIKCEEIDTETGAMSNSDPGRTVVTMSRLEQNTQSAPDPGMKVDTDVDTEAEESEEEQLVTKQPEQESSQTLDVFSGIVKEESAASPGSHQDTEPDAPESACIQVVERSLVCAACDLTFSQRYQLASHLHELHGLEAADISRLLDGVEGAGRCGLHCAACGDAFSSRDRLISHLELEHGFQQPQTQELRSALSASRGRGRRAGVCCPHCSKTFRSQQTKERHVMMFHRDNGQWPVSG